MYETSKLAIANDGDISNKSDAQTILLKKKNI